MWHAKAKGAYAIDSTEAYDNALEAWSILLNSGWTLNAFSGYWGNVGGEGGYNPWRWQSDKVQPSGGSPWTNKGYGLTQFTPASKYIDAAMGYKGYAPNFSDRTGNASDGLAQVLFLNDRADYYPTSRYPETYTEYKVSLESPEYLASVWLYNYERPADPASTEATRKRNARYWFDKLNGVEPPVPPPIGGGTLPFWFMAAMSKRRW